MGVRYEESLEAHVDLAVTRILFYGTQGYGA